MYLSGSAELEIPDSNPGHCITYAFRTFYDFEQGCYMELSPYLYGVKQEVKK